MNPLVIFQDIGTFFRMTQAVVFGRYKMPWKTVGWMVLCLVYLLSPIDVLPDLLPVLGFADDGAFIIFVLLTLHQELAAFRAAEATPKQKPDIIIEAEVVDEPHKNSTEK